MLHSSICLKSHLGMIFREQSLLWNASVEGEGGTITPSGETKVTEGETVEFKITPDKTHKVADVLVNGESVGAVTSYTLKDVKEKCNGCC